MFHISGGNQVNLLLKLPIIASVLYAQAEVAAGSPKARACYTLIAGLGCLTVLIHSAFFLAGSEQFVQPMSIALLLATAVLSTLQLLALRARQTCGNRTPQQLNRKLSLKVTVVELQELVCLGSGIASHDN